MCELAVCQKNISVSSDRAMGAARVACLFAVRFFAYCFFYYFSYFKANQYRQGMRTFSV